MISKSSPLLNHAWVFYTKAAAAALRLAAPHDAAQRRAPGPGLGLREAADSDSEAALSEPP